MHGKNIKAQIIKHYQHLADREAFVTPEMVRNSYQGFGSEYETLLNAFDNHQFQETCRQGQGNKHPVGNAAFEKGRGIIHRIPLSS